MFLVSFFFAFSAKAQLRAEQSIKPGHCWHVSREPQNGKLPPAPSSWAFQQLEAAARSQVTSTGGTIRSDANNVCSLPERVCGDGAKGQARREIDPTKENGRNRENKHKTLVIVKAAAKYNNDILRDAPLCSPFVLFV